MTELTPFDYSHEGTALHGFLARPAGAGPHPAALVMHDALGISTTAKQRARDLAALGYVALVTDMYGGPPESAGGLPLGKAERGAQFAALQAEPALFRSRIVSAFETLRGIPGVDAARIGAIGFCFGGQCVLELARSGADAKGVVSFHGLLTSRQPAEAGVVKVRMLVLTGAKDPFAPPADVQAFQAEMAEAGGDWQMTVYGEGWHAFTDPEIETRSAGTAGLKYDPLIAGLSWAQATAFLQATVAG